MKMQGVELTGPNEETIIIPRPPKMVPVLAEGGEPILGEDGEPLKDEKGAPRAYAKGEPMMNGDGTPLEQEVPGDIIFIARAVLDFEPYEKLHPMPLPRMIQKPGQTPTPHLDDPKFKAETEKWYGTRMLWMYLKSLEATPGLQWEKVKMDDPSTYNLFRAELKSAGFNAIEVNMIVNGCLAANSLDDDKLEQARARFLAGKPRERGR